MSELDREKLDFEKQKHADDIELKRYELDLENNRTRTEGFRDPLFLAIVAAVIGILGNAIVAAINGYLQRDLERMKFDQTQQLASTEAEAERILAQRGAFLWSPKPLNQMIRNCFGIKIDGKAKSKLLGNLASFGVDKAGLKL